MSLEPGSKLGPYEIIEKAGAGGMGEVYKARDSRLDRIVAIKILPNAIAGMPDFKQRFEREARAISSLNHAHICTLYDVGQQDDCDFLVMEFLEGETLSERLQRGPVPYAEMLQIAVQVAGALDAAHRQGLVHRDLKPGNVMLTKEGAKLMDFGLAKMATGGAAAQAVTAITQTTPLTGVGTILGTMQYMSPEQLEGKEADARSDIFAFGALLYELATGRRAFEGSSQATLIAAIIEREPSPISQTIPNMPPLFERLVQKCLAKDPARRWQSAADLCDELRWISQAGSQVGLPAHVARRRKFKFTVARVVGAVAVVVSLVLAWLLFSRPAEVHYTNRFIFSPSRESREIVSVNWSRISPDGRLIAFRATDTLGNNLLWIRPMNSLESYPLRGTENIARQFWSPDSRYLAFFKANQLYKIPVAGGPTQLICEASGADGNWGSKGFVIFDNAASDTLRYVPASGGTPQIATKLDSAAGEQSSAWPWFLSDGIHFLYVCYTKEGRRLKVGSLESDESSVIFNEDQMANLSSRVEFCRQGYLLFIRDKLLLAQKFDENKFKLIGEPVPVAQGIDFSGNASTFGTSDNGVLLYQHTSTSNLSELVWVDRTGKVLEKVGEPDSYRDIRLSPDNSKLAFSLFDEHGDNEDIWIRDFKRNLVSRLTFDKPSNIGPVWSPDGKYIAYGETDDHYFKSAYKRADGQGAVHYLPNLDTLITVPFSWPNDSSIYLICAGNGFDVLRYNLNDSTATPVLTSKYREIFPTESNNGKYLLYSSDESGKSEMYVKELGGTQGRWQISNDVGYMPWWSHNNREIFYVGIADGLNVVDVSMDGGKFEIGQPVQLFRQPLSIGGFNMSRYAVSNDAQRFLLNKPLESKNDDEIIIVQNWLEELKSHD
ncbi:MAG TPA: protein kinase [candidate division Zixibacteria bacterium]|nr:protein kinase [candidate division Zixibacteria bacterium]